MPGAGQEEPEDGGAGEQSQQREQIPTPAGPMQDWRPEGDADNQRRKDGAGEMMEPHVAEHRYGVPQYPGNEKPAGARDQQQNQIPLSHAAHSCSGTVRPGRRRRNRSGVATLLGAAGQGTSFILEEWVAMFYLNG